jgi:hypothetical protein
MFVRYGELLVQLWRRNRITVCNCEELKLGSICHVVAYVNKLPRCSVPWYSNT